MRSRPAWATLKAWERGKLFTTKGSELLHAQERRHLQAASAPGRVFAQHAEQDFMKKVRVTHMRLGGSDPLKQAPLRRSSEQKQMALLDTMIETKAMNPFEGLNRELGPIGEMSAVNFGISEGSDIEAGDILAASRAGCLPAICGPLAPPMLALPPPPPPPGFVDDNAQEEAGGEISEHSGSGMNPYFHLLNIRRKSAKQSVGGRVLTPDETKEVHEEAKENYRELKEGDGSLEALRTLHRKGVRDRQGGKKAGAEDAEAAKAMMPYALQPYRSVFGIGTKEHGIDPKRFCQAFASIF